MAAKQKAFKTALNLYTVRLHLLQIHAGDPTFTRVLSELHNGIEAVEKYLDQAKRSGNDDYYDALCDDECAFIETIAGSAFIVAQTYITGIVESVKKIAVALCADGKHGIPCHKAGILRLGSHKIQGTKYTLAEAINAFANYFKHRDEWRYDWKRLTRADQLATAKVISDLGASQGSTGNLRTGLESLGYPDYGITKMGADLEAWAKSVEKQCHNLLKQLKCIK